MTRFAYVVLALSLSIMVGCASGVKYKDMSGGIPAIGKEQGRIYFYRDNSPVGAAIQPPIYLNGQEVGPSQPGGFFYVDQPAGAYKVLCSTEVDKALTFTLKANETRYVRTRIQMGLVVGRVNPELEDEAKALDTLANCKHIAKKK